MRYILITLSVIVLFAACNKKPKATTSTENTLRTGKWKLASGTLTVKKPNGKDTILDYLKFIPDCYKDDYLVFDSLNRGLRYTGSNICSPSDPDYFTFLWQLKGNGSTIDLFNGFNFIYGVVDTVQPYHFDTLSQDPYLVLDTVSGTLDTTFPPKIFIELDTVRELRFTGVPAGLGPTGYPQGGFDIYAADLRNVSQGSFTIHFQMHSIYPDSTAWHTASILLPLDPVINPDSFQVTKLDTFNYSLTFTNF